MTAYATRSRRFRSLTSNARRQRPAISCARRWSRTRSFRDGPFDAPVFVSTTYVLENYPYPGSGYTYFNYDFTLIIDPVFDASCTGAQSVNIARLSAEPERLSRRVPEPADRRLHEQRLVRPRAQRRRPHGADLRQRRARDAHAVRRVVHLRRQRHSVLARRSRASPRTARTRSTNVPVYYYTGGGFAGDFTSVDAAQLGHDEHQLPRLHEMNFDFNGATDPRSPAARPAPARARGSPRRHQRPQLRISVASASHDRSRPRGGIGVLRDARPRAIAHARQHSASSPA